ncbi:unnamed protein product [Phyllotreta striolata]|uniref:DNA-(apurinic or apyrimidinic site) endonuclease n=1 Tax=Phyllotreta striolata TaxID=444603 RepID=A0A9N9THI3_PHYSR|nr:unnamed protein product [Phyllotreta striolata]
MPPKRKAATATAKSKVENEEVSTTNDVDQSETTTKRAKVIKSTTTKAAKGKVAVKEKRGKKNKVENDSEGEEQIPEPAPVPPKKKRAGKSKVEIDKEVKKTRTRKNNKLDDIEDPNQEESDGQKVDEADKDSEAEEEPVPVKRKRGVKAKVPEIEPEPVPVKNKRGRKAKIEVDKEAKKTNTRKNNKPEDKEDLTQEDAQIHSKAEDESETEEQLPEPLPVPAKNKRGRKAKIEDDKDTNKTNTRKNNKPEDTEDLNQEESDAQIPSKAEEDPEIEEPEPLPVPVKNKRGRKAKIQDDGEAKKTNTQKNDKLEDIEDLKEEESDAQNPSKAEKDSETEQQLPEHVPVKNKRGRKPKIEDAKDTDKTNTQMNDKPEDVEFVEDLNKEESDAQNPSKAEEDSETEQQLPEPLPVPVKNKRGGKAKIENDNEPKAVKAGKRKAEKPEDPNEEDPDVVPAKTTKVKKPLMNKVNTNWETIDFKCSKPNKDGKNHNIIISAWNTGGLRSWVNKECHEYLTHEKPDIICLQETKCAIDKIPEEIANLKDYQKYWTSSKDNDGYAGVGLLTVPKPKNVTYGINNEELDDEGRCITAEYEKFFLINVYVPNAGRKLVTLPKRLKWNEAFKRYVSKLDEQKPVIICGDMNVSHNEIDLARPKSNMKNAGFTREEREGMTEFLNSGYVDVYRELYPDQKDVYSFWSYMSNARAKNIGWRLDYFLTSERIISRVCDISYRTEVLGSDHCPLTLFINM